MKKVRVNQKQHLHLTPCFSLSSPGTFSIESFIKNFCEINQVQDMIFGGKSILKSINTKNISLIVITKDTASLPMSEPILSAAYFASVPILEASIDSKELGRLVNKGTVGVVAVTKSPANEAHVNELIKDASEIIKNTKLSNLHIETDMFLSAGDSRRTKGKLY